MNIIIAGCGKVGTTLGEQLVRERHEVTFIDTAPELLKKVMGMIDVQVIEGNCTVYSTLKEAGIEHADLFIAVTDSDEINLLSCLIAKKASNCHTVARVRNPEYNEDIQFIKNTGANTIRLPFHYKLFTDEDFMGLTANQDGFARVDSVVEWCREADLYLILDMHDAPGGQTGDNIDDSYGYPWLFESEASQQLYCDIWRKIADRYKNEPVILGYELFNEPIAPYFPNMEELNGKLEDIYKKGVAAIREVDNNHIILLGGAQWNGNFKPFKDSKFDDKIMYTCHRYGGDPTKDDIQTIIDFRDSVNLPMYMGEIGHNTDEWQAAFCQTMRENNIGYTFWPYKKMDGSSFVGITPPENWANILYFSESPRTSYKEIRDARPDQMMVRKAMMDFIEACKLKNCVVQEGYIQSLGMK